MALEIKYQPPHVEFDHSLADQLARLPEVPRRPSSPPAYDSPVRRSPFLDYVRILTPQGGILILYKDRARGWLYTALRLIAWFVLMGVGAWLLRQYSLSPSKALVWFLILCAFNLFCVTRTIKISHSVEIRHDRMILDTKHVFWASDIGVNYPELKTKDDDPNRLVICGICGTRFVEYMTANRIDDNDRMPEVLAADLRNAMQQLWERTEVVFDG
jgi:hypothetical protein